jgi:hypothetical protein
LNSNDWVIEASPEEDSGDDLVGKFDENVGKKECAPRISFAGSLADFV